MKSHDKLRQAIGQFRYQRIYSRGMAATHWDMHKELVKKADNVYNDPCASKSELTEALEILLKIAMGYSSPRFKLDNRLRIEQAEKVLAETSRVYIWQRLNLVRLFKWLSRKAGRALKSQQQSQQNAR